MKYTFKIMWKDRRRLIGILIEQTVVFLILTFCILSLSKSIWKTTERGLLDTQNVILLGYTLMDPNESFDIKSNVNAIIDNLKSRSYIKRMTNSFNLAPYLREDNEYLKDTISFDGNKLKAFVKGADRDALSVFGFKVEQGEWLSTLSRLGNNNVPTVITRDLAIQAGIQNSPIGKTFEYRNETLEVIGVIDGLKHSVFSDPVPAIIIPFDLTNILFPHSAYREVCVKIQPGFSNELYDDYHNEFKRLIKNENIIPHTMDLNTQKSIYMMPLRSQFALLGVPTLFLFIFSFIGTVGIIWVNTQKRLNEFAVKVAIGATKRKVIKSILMEAFIITTIAMLPSILIVLLSGNLNLINLIPIGITILIVTMFSLFSSYIPARKIIKLRPAEALKYE